MAPEADLVFIHLASQPLSGLANMGDSVRLLEAIKFIEEFAGERPFVINLSMGRHGGPHDGTTLLEQALDTFHETGLNRLIVQSAGNYFQSRSHAQGQINPGKAHELTWKISRFDRTPNELEIWYSNKDVFDVFVQQPGSDTLIKIPLGGAKAIFDNNNQEIARFYHRAFDPNSPSHHFDGFLKPSAFYGDWKVIIKGREVRDGRFHAWIERDSRGFNQSKFPKNSFEKTGTIGSICNGYLPICVGAADFSGETIEPATFASAGPTRDGRQKPDLCAPGVKVRAARSARKSEDRPNNETAFMSGASQACPYVAGYAASLLSDSQQDMNVHQIRAAIMSGLKSYSGHHSDLEKAQLGYGFLGPMPTKASLFLTNSKTVKSQNIIPNPRKTLLPQS
jgi:subtilisin family serine protease